VICRKVFFDFYKSVLLMAGVSGSKTADGYLQPYSLVAAQITLRLFTRC
jgi:hypothetical protein